MHILHYISSVRIESGGPAEGLRQIIHGYIGDGHNAEVLTFDAPDPAVSSEFPVPVHALGPIANKYKYNVAAIPWLQKNLSRFEGVVVHGLWLYQGLSALLTIKPPQRYAVFTHGMLDPWFNRKYPLKYLKKMPYWLAVERRVLGNAHRVLFTSASEQELASRSFPFSHWRGQVVPYGTAGPPPNAETQRECLYKSYPELRHRPFILFAARIHEKKGCDLLVEAYARVSKTLQLPWLVIAGPDQVGLQASLQSQAKGLGIADKILWPGMIAGDVKWGAFRACEAFVLPSHQENFGIAVAEALSCGKPVLISDQVNICGQIREASAGIVAPDTLDGTISLLEQWAAMSDSDRERTGENAIRTFRAHFNSQETSRAIVSLFEGS